MQSPIQAKSFNSPLWVFRQCAGVRGQAPARSLGPGPGSLNECIHVSAFSSGAIISPDYIFFCSSFSHITQVSCSSSPGSGFSPTHLQEEEKPFARDLGFTFVYRSHICFFPAICVLFYLFILDGGMQKHLDQDKVQKNKKQKNIS